MNTKPVVRITQALVTLVFVLGVAWTPNTNARADWPFPIFMLNVNNDSSWRGLDAWNWPLGSQVTLTVDNPNTTKNPDYTEVQTMGEPNPGQTTISHAMYMQDYDLEEHFEGLSGFIIILSDGVQTKTMIVPVLEITGYDVDNDIIIGISDPFTTVTVAVGRSDPEEYAERNVVTDYQGNWLANFAISNNIDEAIYNLRPGDYVEPLIRDDDQDFIILRDWRVPIEWTMKGFYQPVDMNGIYNIVKGGSTVPLKFEIFAGSTELTDIAIIKSLTYAQTSCDANATTDEIETITMGGTSLRYDATSGQFIYDWKTPRIVGVCYRVTLTTVDGSSLVTYFKFK